MCVLSVYDYPFLYDNQRPARRPFLMACIMNIQVSIHPTNKALNVYVNIIFSQTVFYTLIEIVRTYKWYAMI